jgi:hypothetical protein
METVPGLLDLVTSGGFIDMGIGQFSVNSIHLDKPSQ